jgi:hypothetical protein
MGPPPTVTAGGGGQIGQGPHVTASGGPRHPSIKDLPRFSVESNDKLDSTKARLFWEKFTSAMAIQRIAADLWHECLFQVVEGRVGGQWAMETLRPMGAVSPEILKEAFLGRFADEVRSRAAEARDALYEQGVAQQNKESVLEYIGKFKDTIVHVPTLSAQDQVRFFHKGLKEPLRTKCACNHLGEEFETLKEICTFALGEERRLKVMGKLSHGAYAVVQSAKGAMPMEVEEANKGAFQATKGKTASRKRKAQGTANAATAKTTKGGYKKAKGNTGKASVGQKPGQGPSNPHEPSTIVDRFGRTLTKSEVGRRMQQNICFTCGEPRNVGHPEGKCPHRH